MSVMCCARGTTGNLRMGSRDVRTIFCIDYKYSHGARDVFHQIVENIAGKIDGGQVEGNDFVRIAGKVSELK